MRHVVLAALLASSVIATAAETPYDKFTGKDNFTNSTQVKWIQVPNVLATCDKESKSRGFPGYNYAIDGCSFWDTNSEGHTCLIITPFSTDFWTLGHELRHCFQGSYHK
jgi:hypothetical protein